MSVYIYFSNCTQLLPTNQKSLKYPVYKECYQIKVLPAHSPYLHLYPDMPLFP